MIYCLDTNIIVDIFRGNKNFLSKIEESIKEKNQFCITILTLAELLKGAFLSNKKEESIIFVEDFIKNIEILSLDKESCKTYGEKFAELQKKGKKTEEIDLFIGSIVLTNGLTLITRNKKHFENISELKLVEW